MGINEAFSGHLGSNFDQSCNYYNFIGNRLSNLKKGKVFFIVFKRKLLTEMRNISSDIVNTVQNQIKLQRKLEFYSVVLLW